MKNFILTLFLVCLMAANVTATVTSTFTSAATPGGDLADHVTNTWDVNTHGDGWLSASLIVDLISGVVYQDGAGSNAPPDPNMFVATPSLQYDSYMTGGTDSEAPPSRDENAPTESPREANSETAPENATSDLMSA